MKIKKLVSCALITSMLLSHSVASFAAYSPYELSSVATQSLTVSQQNEVVQAITLQNMTQKQKIAFNKAVEVEVNRQQFSTQAEKDQFRKSLLSMFDENNKKRSTALSSKVSARGIMPEHMGVTVNVAASALNVAIAAAVGGVGYGSISAYIKSVGRREAQKLFSKTIQSQIIAWGAPKLATSLGVIVDFVLDYSNFGNMIATYWDEHDAVPKNGWVDFY